MNPARPQILVADDDAAALYIMRATLQSAGFQVSTASDGAEALRKCLVAAYDLVMLDVDMPNGTGYEVCATLRQRLGTALPIVMVTAMDDIASVDQAFLSGATDFIAKPINWALIGHRVRYVLRGSEVLRNLGAAESRMSAVLQALPDLLFELDAEGRYLQYHPPRSASGSRPPEWFIGKTLDEVLPPQAAETCMAALREARRDGSSRGHQLKLEHAGGASWFELSVSQRESDQPQGASFVVLARDVTERRTAQHRIRRLAYFDSLTGLPNRELFQRRLTSALKDRDPGTGLLALLCIDLDNFKRINDTLGHSVGDELLGVFAQRLREAARGASAPQNATAAKVAADRDVARLGGDEFMVLIPHIERPDEAVHVAERIIRELSQPMQLAGGQHEILISPSVGIAIAPTHANDQETMIRNADLAMYFAKRQGAGTCAVFDPAMNAHALKRLTLENKLRQAIAANELSLHYQPQSDVFTGRIVAMEALLRWNSADLGAVAPSEFIPVAEQSGLILTIGEWVLRAACHEAKTWSLEGVPATRVAVNVSGRQLSQRDFPRQVSAILREARLAPELLELEITETVLMENPTWAMEVLKDLKEVGVSISIDDFGTGHSSLGRVRDFPVDRLKIDRAFIQRLDTHDGRAIASAIIAMAKSLALDVVAEGVEEAAHVKFLQDARCSFAQGFHLGRPVPAAEALRILRSSAEDEETTTIVRPKRRAP